MGREVVALRVETRVSRHNSEEDERDDAAWAELREAIEALCAASPLDVMVWGTV
jgi:hypothetical protein